jgi:hypothetical protein
MLEIAEFAVSVLILVAVLFEAVISYKAYLLRVDEAGKRPLKRRIGINVR